MNLKDKRGFWMGEESGKFILGVIAIVLLALLAFKLAGIVIQKSQYEQAKISLEKIETALNSLEEQEEEILIIESPKGWYLTSFRAYPSRIESPVSCSGENCICICPSSEKEACDKKGVCKSLENSKVIVQADSEVIQSLVNVPTSYSEAETIANGANLIDSFATSESSLCESKFYEYQKSGMFYLEDYALGNLIINPVPLKLTFCFVPEITITESGELNQELNKFILGQYE